MSKLLKSLIILFLAEKLILTPSLLRFFFSSIPNFFILKLMVEGTKTRERGVVSSCNEKTWNFSEVRKLHSMNDSEK